MKRVNVRIGLKQRMNEILGTDYSIIEDSGGLPDITPWSIQAAVIANIRRVVSAITAGGQGRPMSGLFISRVNDTKISIRSGYGFTRSGNVVVLENPIEYQIDNNTGTKHIYLKHIMATVDGDDNIDGKKTNFTGKSGYEDIVYDDLAASKKGDVQDVSERIVYITESASDSSDDVVYLGSVTFADDGKIDSIYNSELRGFEPNNPDGDKYVFRSLQCNGEALFNGETTFTDRVIITAEINNPSESELVEFTGYGYKFNEIVEIKELRISRTGSIKVNIDDIYRPGLTQDIIVKDESDALKKLVFAKGILIGIESVS